MNSRVRQILLRLAIVVGWTTALYSIYQLTNRYQIFTPRGLSLTPLDRAIPFWPWTVVPYFILIGGMYLPAFLRTDALFWRSLLAVTIGVLINYTVFALWPTTYPRPMAPTGSGFYLDWYRWLISIDTPANCFPSGHITAPAIGCWALARERPRWKWAILLGFVPLALTILTTKQHYIVDLLGGLVTAAIGLLFARFILPVREGSADPRLFHVFQNPRPPLRDFVE
ncbi:MAG: superfamily protein [Chthoniobacteraceae bacterium]|nr:superfamily protein [Chthoniobacteraceae bacterium]